jgi:hypothetical protein
MRYPRFLATGALVILAAWSFPAQALETTLSSVYLVIGMRDGDPAVQLSNFTLGDSTLDDGNVAVTSEAGTFLSSDMTINATLGVQCAGTAAACTNNGGNLSNTTITPGSVTYEFDFAALLLELGDAATEIAGASPTATIDLSSDGKIDANTTIDNAFAFDTGSIIAGLNIIDIITDGNDFSLENDALLTIDCPVGSFCVFRLDADAGKNFKISNGDMDSALNNVLFFLKTGGDFDFSNTDLNNVAFWNFNGEIGIDNGTGCSQFVATDLISLQDVDFSRCAFTFTNGNGGSGGNGGGGGSTQVPGPAPLALLGVGLVGIGVTVRLRRTIRDTADPSN